MTSAPPTKNLLLQDDDCFRPASPKYDENNYFYHTPAVFKQAGPSSRHWATPGKFLAAAPSQRVVEVQEEAAAAAAAAANSGRGSQESSACKRTAADVSREPQGKGIACRAHCALRWTWHQGSTAAGRELQTGSLQPACTALKPVPARLQVGPEHSRTCPHHCPSLHLLSGVGSSQRAPLSPALRRPPSAAALCPRSPHLLPCPAQGARRRSASLASSAWCLARGSS